MDDPLLAQRQLGMKEAGNWKHKIIGRLGLQQKSWLQHICYGAKAKGWQPAAGLLPLSIAKHKKDE